MTSQGVGEPFAPEKKIMGYQACGLKGSVYIDTDEEYEEKLTNIVAGDEIIFRYVRSIEAWSEMKLTARGSEEVEVLLDGKSAGIVAVENGVQVADRLLRRLLVSTLRCRAGWTGEKNLKLSLTFPAIYGRINE